MEARIVGDVDHARPAEKRAVRVDDRRAVERPVAVALEEIEHDDDAEVTCRPRKEVGRRARDGLRKLPRRIPGGPLRMEPLERELRERDDRRPVAGRAREGLEPATHVVILVFGCRLLDEGDSHKENSSSFQLPASSS